MKYTPNLKLIIYELLDVAKLSDFSDDNVKIDTAVGKNTQDILKNVQSIEKHSQDILQHSQSISENTQDILENAQNILKNTQDISKNSQDIINLGNYINSKSSQTLKQATDYTDNQMSKGLSKLLATDIYSVLYQDPFDRVKKPLQSILDSIANNILTAYSWAEFQGKNLTWAQFDALGLTWATRNKGGW